jgi:hypothetical protein
MNRKILMLILTAFGLLLAGCSGEERVELFNGTDLGNWEKVLLEPGMDPDEVFRAEDGVIRVSGVPNGYLVTRESYSNYRLHVEWRWTDEPANSGVLMHIQEVNREEWPLCIEAQLRSGKAGDFVLMGHGTGITVGDSVLRIEEGERRYKASPKFLESTENPAGEWNVYKITCTGDGRIELLVNGTVQNAGSDASYASGRIALQSEGGPIEFREVYLEPLEN